ncbi:MAG: GTPase HflX [Candidatus Omnitrophota bacterium]
MERALLVTVDFHKNEAWSAEERSMELAELARSSGAKVIREEIVRRHEPTPACFIGTGKAEELSAACAADNINLVIFNNDLSGTQQKNLEDLIRKRVIDRTQLILDIFAKRAHTGEGKIQVELAQLLYLMPRLTGKGVEMSRLGGGIGTSGPGEKKLEIDRRRIKERVFKLKRELEGLHKRREMMRKKRKKFSVPAIAIIGYTNAGKSTLLNSLTGSDAAVRDKMFATLDPTVRRFRLAADGCEILFIDTVGFLNELPHHLIEAFKATLEEVTEADMLLHIIDISHPKAVEQSDAVFKVLAEIGAQNKPILTVLNKIDKVTEPGRIERMKESFGGAAAISAMKKEGFGELIDSIRVFLKADRHENS